MKACECTSSTCTSCYKSLTDCVCECEYCPKCLRSIVDCVCESKCCGNCFKPANTCGCRASWIKRTALAVVGITIGTAAVVYGTYKFYKMYNAKPEEPIKYETSLEWIKNKGYSKEIKIQVRKRDFGRIANGVTFTGTAKSPYETAYLTIKKKFASCSQCRGAKDFGRYALPAGWKKIVLANGDKYFVDPSGKEHDRPKMSKVFTKISLSCGHCAEPGCTAAPSRNEDGTFQCDAHRKKEWVANCAECFGKGTTDILDKKKTMITLREAEEDSSKVKAGDMVELSFPYHCPKCEDREDKCGKNTLTSTNGCKWGKPEFSPQVQINHLEKHHSKDKQCTHCDDKPQKWYKAKLVENLKCESCGHIEAENKMRRKTYKIDKELVRKTEKNTPKDWKNKIEQDERDEHCEVVTRELTEGWTEITCSKSRHGKVEVSKYYQTPEGKYQYEEPLILLPTRDCTDCNSTGKEEDGAKCVTCNGTGTNCGKCSEKTHFKVEFSHEQQMRMLSELAESALLPCNNCNRDGNKAYRMDYLRQASQGESICKNCLGTYFTPNEDVNLVSEKDGKCLKEPKKHTTENVCKAAGCKSWSGYNVRLDKSIPLEEWEVIDNTDRPDNEHPEVILRLKPDVGLEAREEGEGQWSFWHKGKQRRFDRKLRNRLHVNGDIGAYKTECDKLYVVKDLVHTNEGFIIKAHEGKNSSPFKQYDLGKLISLVGDAPTNPLHRTVEVTNGPFNLGNAKFYWDQTKCRFFDKNGIYSLNRDKTMLFKDTKVIATRTIEDCKPCNGTGEAKLDCPKCDGERFVCKDSGTSRVKAAQESPRYNKNQNFCGSCYNKCPMVPCNDANTRNNDGCCTECKQCSGKCPGCEWPTGLCKDCAGTGNSSKDGSKPIHRLYSANKDDDIVETLITEKRLEVYVNKKWVLVKERTTTKSDHDEPSWKVRFEDDKKDTATTCILLSESDNLIRVLNCNEDSSKVTKCGSCNGHGVRTCDCPTADKCSACDGNAYIMSPVDCDQCKGSGRFRTNEWNCQGSTKAFRVKPSAQPMSEMSHPEVISWAIRELEDHTANQHLSAKMRILKKETLNGNAMVSKSRAELKTCGFEDPEGIQVIIAKTMNVNHALTLATELGVSDSEKMPLDGFKWLTDMDMKACSRGWVRKCSGCTACVDREPKREGAEFGQFWADCKAVPQEAMNQERKCSKSPYSRLLTNPDLEQDYKKSKPPCSNSKCKNGWIDVKYWPDQDCPDCELNTKCKDCNGVDSDKCSSCDGSGLVDIPKWKLRARQFLNNGKVVATLKDVAQFAVSQVETNEVVADLRNQYKEMKRQK